MVANTNFSALKAKVSAKAKKVVGNMGDLLKAIQELQERSAKVKKGFLTAMDLINDKKVWQASKGSKASGSMDEYLKWPAPMRTNPKTQKDSRKHRARG